MQCAARIGPGVITAVQIIRASAIARNRANAPIVPAKLQWLCWGKRRLASAACVGATNRTASQTWRRPQSAPMMRSVSLTGGGKLRTFSDILTNIGLTRFYPAELLPGYSDDEALELECHHE